MTSTPKLVFLDTEFTNLDPRLADVIEAAWAVGDGDVHSTYFEHTLEHASPEALAVNRYFERGLDRFLGTTPPMTVNPWHIQLIKDLTGSTIIAENYGIDVAVLSRKLGFEPWHHRKIELSTLSMAVFDLDRPEGLHATATRLRDLGFEITTPDHTAAADVTALRECYNALRKIRRAGNLRIKGPSA